MKHLSHLAVIRLEGVDAGDYLNRQLSADISRLTSGNQTFACLCKPNGRVVALLLVVADDNAFFVVCAATLAESVQAHLQRFVFRDKVVITVPEDLAVLGDVNGEGPRFKLGSAGPDDTDCAQADWKAAELAAGIAWLDQETSDEFLPQMLGYEAIGALSFRKGCYPGQEIITRMRHLGKQKRHALVVKIGELVDVAPLDKLMLNPGEQSLEGVVVDSVFNGQRDTLLYLVVRTREQIEVNSLKTVGEPVAVGARWVWPMEES